MKGRMLFCDFFVRTPMKSAVETEPMRWVFVSCSQSKPQVHRKIGSLDLGCGNTSPEPVGKPSIEQDPTSTITDPPYLLNRNVSRWTESAVSRRKFGKEPLKPRSRSTGMTCSVNAAIILSRTLDIPKRW